MGFAEPANKGCIKFSHGGFVIINPYIFFVEQFQGWFLDNAERHGNRGHHAECNLHSVAGCKIFKVVFEIVCGPGLLEFFQAKYFIALAGLHMNGIFMGGFCFSDEEGNFGNTWVTILRFFIFFWHNGVRVVKGGGKGKLAKPRDFQRNPFVILCEPLTKGCFRNGVAVGDGAGDMLIVVFGSDLGGVWG